MKFILLAFAAGCLSAPAQAAPDRVALVIGNGAYSFATRLANPPNDAADMAKALREIGFDVVEGRDLDRRGMEEKVRAFGDKLDAAKIALFFYAGHGLQVAGKNYLVPVDAKLQKPGDLGLDTIDVQLVLQQMEAEQRINLVFLDACRDNPLARSFASRLGASRSAAVGQGLASIQSAVGTMIAFATEPDQVALDGQGRNSPFTTALLNHIREPGVDISVMMRHVRNDVLAATGQRQVPWDHSSLTAAVVLVPGSGQEAVPSAPTGVKRSTPAIAASQQSAADAAQAWSATKDTTSPAVLEAFIKQFGTSLYGSMARARLKELRAAQAKPAVVAAIPAAANVVNGESRENRQDGPVGLLVGRWHWKCSCPVGNYSGEFEIRPTSGNTFSGEFFVEGPGPISSGRLEGNRVTFTRQYQFLGTKSQSWRGTVSPSGGNGARIVGSYTEEWMGVDCSVEATKK